MRTLNQQKARNQLARDPGRVVPCPHGQQHLSWDCLNARLHDIGVSLNKSVAAANSATRKGRQS